MKSQLSIVMYQQKISTTVASPLYRDLISSAPLLDSWPIILSLYDVGRASSNDL